MEMTARPHPRGRLVTGADVAAQHHAMMTEAVEVGVVVGGAIPDRGDRESHPPSRR